MSHDNVQINDVEDTTSEEIVDSEDESVDSSEVILSESQDRLYVSRINGNENFNIPAVNVPDRTPISHISSVALQNSTDITFGNKTLYNGPVTVNQYGIESPSETSHLSKKSLLFLNKGKILVLSAIIVIILVSIATALTLHVKNNTENQKETDNDTDIYKIDDSPLTLVTREQWKAKPNISDVNNLTTPVDLVIISHTDQSTCVTMETCALRVRQAQDIHFSRGYSDIGYNFLVGGDGAAYEGRGWNGEGAHTLSYNNRSIGVSFIGNFQDMEPPNQQIIALLKLIRDGVQMRKISENYTLIGAKQVSQTVSPGQMLYKILTKLPHWSDRIEI